MIGVEIDHHAYHVIAVLGDADVDHTAALHLVVHPDRSAQCGSLEVENDARGRAEREVLNGHRPRDRHHYLGATCGRNNAQRPYLAAFAPFDCHCVSDVRMRAQRKEHHSDQRRDPLHCDLALVVSLSASTSCLLKPYSSIVNVTDFGEMRATRMRPRVCPALTLYCSCVDTSRMIATERPCGA